MERIEKCRSCDSAKLHQFCDLGDQPLANSLLKTPGQPEEKYPLQLCFCDNCQLVQLQDTADPKKLFSNYVWVTHTSSTARNQAKIFCEEALSRLTLAPQSYVLEIASNDGTFLKPFMDKGIEVLGVDPAGNIVKEALASNIPTKCDFFGLNVARDIVKEKGCPDIVFARNVLAHVANLHDFVQGIECLLGTDGLAVVEFHYAKRIQLDLQYDSVYHEHLCYFTAQTAQRLFEQVGLEIVDVSEGPISGGALILYLRKKGGKAKVAVQQYFDRELREKINDFSSWENFSENVKKHREQLRTLLEAERKKGALVVGYGASARSSTMLNYCQISGNDLKLIADQNPLKYGLYTAGTRIKILTAQEVFNLKPDTVLILAWNFTQEIVAFLRDDLGYKGSVIIPLPGMPNLTTI